MGRIIMPQAENDLVDMVILVDRYDSQGIKGRIMKNSKPQEEIFLSQAELIKCLQPMPFAQIYESWRQSFWACLFSAVLVFGNRLKAFLPTASFSQTNYLPKILEKYCNSPLLQTALRWITSKWKIKGIPAYRRLTSPTDPWAFFIPQFTSSSNIN